MVSDASSGSPSALVGLLAVLVVGSDSLDARGEALPHLRVVPRARARDGAARARRRPRPSASRRGVDALRGRTRGSYLLNNLATYATLPAGRRARAAVDPVTLGADHGGGDTVAVFAVFVVANVAQLRDDRGPHGAAARRLAARVFRTVYLPVLPWELATASLTAMAVYGFEVYGAGVVGLFALALGVCQLLLRALLAGQEHGEEVERRTRPARRPPRGDARAAAGDARAARPERRPPRRGRRPLRARARARGGPVRARAGRRAHRGAAARHRQGGAPRPPARRPLASCTRRSGGCSSATRSTARACCCASRASARSRPPCSRTTSASTARATRTALPATTSRWPPHPRDRRGLRRPDRAGLLPPCRLPPPRPRTSCAAVAGAQLDGRLVWLFVTQVLPGRLLEHDRQDRRPRGRAAGPAHACAAPSTARSCSARPSVAWLSRSAAPGRPDRQPPHQRAEREQDAEVPDVDPALEAERGVADELDAVIERVELRQRLRPLGQAGRAGRTCRRPGTSA